MAVTIKIETVDRTSLIEWKSFVYDQALTSQIDTVSFTIKKHSAQLYKPSLLDDIEIEENAVKIFGGKIIEVEEIIEGVVEKIRILAKDHSHEMDSTLVVASYENTTIDVIIADIVTNILPAGFTDTGVVVTSPIDFVAFNYEQPSKVFQQLAELVGADWYVDENKDIQFFLKNDITAPFNLTDTNQNYIFKSLRIKRDIKSLRNSIFVRGGTFLGDTFEEIQEADGDTKVFVQGFRYSDITVDVDSGGGYVSKTIGIDNIGDPTLFDVLYNFAEKAVKFPDGSKPASTDLVKITGKPHIPVIIQAKDAPSIALYGEFEYKIIDKSINSKEGARQRATAEIIAWADEINQGGFKTQKSGLKVGQTINIQSDIRGMDEDFVISRIKTTFHTPTEFIHQTILMTQRTFGMVEYLQQQLIAKDKEIELNPDEVLDKIETAIEGITLTEGTPTIAKIHNPQNESATLGEVVVAQALNYAVVFVYGSFPTPTGFNREGAYGGAVFS